MHSKVISMCIKEVIKPPGRSLNAVYCYMGFYTAGEAVVVNSIPVYSTVYEICTRILLCLVFLCGFVIASQKFRRIWVKLNDVKRQQNIRGNISLDVLYIRERYNDVIMSSLSSQITSLTIVYSSVYSGADQRKYQSSASLAFVRGIHRWPVNSPHKWPVTRKMFPFDDVLMDCIGIHVTN